METFNLTLTNYRLNFTRTVGIASAAVEGFKSFRKNHEDDTDSEQKWPSTFLYESLSSISLQMLLIIKSSEMSFN